MLGAWVSTLAACTAAKSTLGCVFVQFGRFNYFIQISNCTITSHAVAGVFFTPQLML
jgi:hypothetical protein